MKARLTLEQAQAEVAEAVAEFGPNQSHGGLLAYRHDCIAGGGCSHGNGGVVAFTFVRVHSGRGYYKVNFA